MILREVVSEIQKAIKSETYLSLTHKQRSAAQIIFTHILASDQHYCKLSNRNIALEAGTSKTLVDQVRHKLEKAGIISLIKCKNGNRTNPIYRIQMAQAGFFSYEPNHNTYQTKLAIFKKLKFNIDDIVNYDWKVFTTDKLFEISNLAEKENFAKNFNTYIALYNKSKIYAPEVVSCLDMGKNFSQKPFSNELLNGLDASVLSQDRIEMLEEAAKMESLGYKVSPLFRNNSGETKGRVLVGSNKLKKLSKKKRLAILYEYLVAGNSDDVKDFALRMAKAGVYNIFERNSYEDFDRLIRVRLQNLFEWKALCNGFSVLLPKDVAVIDIDHESYFYLKDLCVGSFIQKTERGFHCFVKMNDSLKVLSNCKGFDILSGDNQVFFNTLDGHYQYESGNLEYLKDVNLSFLNLNKIVEPVKIENKIVNNPKAKQITFKSNSFMDFFLGMRNVNLFRYGRSLRAKGFNQSYIKNSLDKANEKECEKPLTESELSCIVRSVINRPNKTGFIQYVPMFSR